MICCICGKEISVYSAKYCSECSKSYCPKCAGHMCDCAGDLNFYG